MDVVVVLALIVLSAVFIISLVILALMCYRRRHNKMAFRRASPIKMVRVTGKGGDIERLDELNSIIGELLERNSWVHEVTGLLHHSVAILKLCQMVTEELAPISLDEAPQPINEAIAMAVRNIFPRFDDLMDVVSASSVDIRVLEARTVSLATVCWALYLPFTMLNPCFKKTLFKPLNDMNKHLVTIRAACELAITVERKAQEKAQQSNQPAPPTQDAMIVRTEVRNETVADEAQAVEDVDAEPSEAHTETTPLVSSQVSMAFDTTSSNERIPTTLEEIEMTMITTSKLNGDGPMIIDTCPSVPDDALEGVSDRRPHPPPADHARHTPSTPRRDTDSRSSST
ncbi:unnamed protein product [Caenorhabditis bovis]|uniref:Transmembrane protein 98 n=1 Tax=Caenorhabditis bovis TaxID=2654633 RepID=A0A8S1FE29_9PELO|nr:unnamed protein product [Caenorhabditis bovis]